MIPREFHRIWFGDPLPEVYEDFWRGFREQHPGWTFTTWDKQGLRWLKNRNLFNTTESYRGKSDIARYEILEQFGGVYVDCDTECLRPFDSLLRLGVRAFAGFEDQRSIANGVMGSEPHHPFIEMLVDELPAYVEAREGRSDQRRTGPGFLTDMWRPHAGEEGLVLCRPITFYPVHWKNKHMLGGTYPKESYAVQHWGGTA